MRKENCKTIKLNKGEINLYDFGSIRLHAYKTNDYIDDEVFILEKNHQAICIELPCFVDNIKELEAYLKENEIKLVAKLVSYHAAGATFMQDVPNYSTHSAVQYNTYGQGYALVQQFKTTFKDIFDENIASTTVVLKDGEINIAGIQLIIKENQEAFDIEIPEINCVYTHMLGHNCHSIVAGCPHADGMISMLNYYLRKNFSFVLTSHYTPEDLKDVQTKIAYLNKVKEVALECQSKEQMKEELMRLYPEYSGLNYLDMTVGFFFQK